MEKLPRKNLERPEDLAGDAEKIKKVTGEKTVEQNASPETLRKYLYNFAYTTPGRSKKSESEDLREIFIIADSREKALEWGKHLSDAYVEYLAKTTNEFVGKGAEWIESEDELREHGPLEDYSEAPLLRYGEEADLSVLFKE